MAHAMGGISNAIFAMTMRSMPPSPCGAKMVLCINRPLDSVRLRDITFSMHTSGRVLMPLQHARKALGSAPEVDVVLPSNLCFAGQTALTELHRRFKPASEA